MVVGAEAAVFLVAIKTLLVVTEVLLVEIASVVSNISGDNRNIVKLLLFTVLFYCKVLCVEKCFINKVVVIIIIMSLVTFAIILLP